MPHYAGSRPPSFTLGSGSSLTGLSSYRPQSPSIGLPVPVEKSIPSRPNPLCFATSTSATQTAHSSSPSSSFSSASSVAPSSSPSSSSSSAASASIPNGSASSANQEEFEFSEEDVKQVHARLQAQGTEAKQNLLANAVAAASITARVGASAGGVVFRPFPSTPSATLPIVTPTPAPTPTLEPTSGRFGSAASLPMSPGPSSSIILEETEDSPSHSQDSTAAASSAPSSSSSSAGSSAGSAASSSAPPPPIEAHSQLQSHFFC